ncbi:alanine racemase [Leifsonia sp. PS1209]|uniref:alanine racemase n=1 Tax=Leifsonia sp. PS1209 TaxID=2724914 RepID=UPI001FFA8E2C|nr:alanine racemase [Leifsonia sp. PS1209]
MLASKAMPLAYTADEVAALAERRPPLTDFPTPLVTVSEAAVQHNLDTMAAWCAAAGVGIAPHGKTTMNRDLWQRQLDAGAWGITVATPWQLSVALEWNIPRVLLANALVQPDALRFVAPHAERVLVWADSVRAVEIMDAVLATADDRTSPLGVLVELGAPGGRTGARSVEDALAVAEAVAASASLRLAGVAGYEGALAHDGTDAALGVVRSYLQRMLALHDAIEAAGLYPDDAPTILTAGGSAYFDVVAEVLAPRRDLAGERGRAVDVLLRSGAYITHDDGFYSGITPLGRGPGGEFRSAIHGWATVVSRPEPGLVLVDAGKRDFPYDEGLPVPQALRRFGERTVTRFPDAIATAMNDQHTFVRVPESAVVEVGDVIRFGLSHPCTTFDKWRALPVLDDVTAEMPHVIGLLETAFG